MEGKKDMTDGGRMNLGFRIKFMLLRERGQQKNSWMHTEEPKNGCKNN